MTQELFREDCYLKETRATVTEVLPEGLVLDKTIFYPVGGGQPGDTGRLCRSEQTWTITDTRIEKDSGQLIHIVDLPEGGALQSQVSSGEELSLVLDWKRRYSHMRMHTCLHLLCSLIHAPVTGGNIAGNKGRLDFALDASPDKAELNDQLNALIQTGHPVSFRWITDEELDARPDLVKTLSVKPPRGAGRVRLVDVSGVDLQPCGGTHVKNTREIGRVKVGKIENKGKSNRRINLELI